ncbi:MAG: MotA/TolQ/ExbB proton channel family protein [Verrucomicrobia bacterium]|jgi:biopolymer transport protein ExbB|nr:MotA/TolQ/ExbB proton channel family protein [Verrucomicrobiota bacterium]
MNAWLQHPLQYWRSGGPLLIPLAVVCFGIWLYLLRGRQRLLGASSEAERIADTLKQGAGAELKRMTGGLARIVNDVIAKRDHGLDAGAAFDEESGRFADQLKRDIVILAALTTVAPLLGLLGTVMGMIQTFDAVATTSGETASRVASGVSRALITTQVGLAIAIPGFFGLARLRRLSHQLQAQLGTLKLHTVLLQMPDSRTAHTPLSGAVEHHNIGKLASI